MWRGHTHTIHDVKEDGETLKYRQKVRKHIGDIKTQWQMTILVKDIGRAGFADRIHRVLITDHYQYHGSIIMMPF